MNQTPEDRIELIKTYLKRLSNGEELESVQKDFVENFKNVDSMEIMQAEQKLISEGTPVEEIQKLCDIHSALFHGKTSEEQHITETQVVKKVNPNDYPDKDKKAKELEAIPGHPLNIFELENEKLKEILKETEEDLNNGERLKQIVELLLPLTIHYAKKGDLLYPHLKVEYDVTGPSNVMWTVDDEIRDDLVKLSKQDNINPDDLKTVIKRINEMIYKEENILFPACALMFTQEDWDKIKKDQTDYAPCFDVEMEEVNIESEQAQVSDNLIKLPGGNLTLEQLKGILRDLPLEITFIDDKDINRYFNEGPKVFKRPLIALGHDVYSCHPPKVEKVVKSIITDFKDGKRDKVPIWMEKRGKPYLVTYYAVRDKDGKYLGTMETVQPMEAIKEHFEKPDKKSSW